MWGGRSRRALITQAPRPVRSRVGPRRQPRAATKDSAMSATSSRANASLGGLAKLMPLVTPEDDERVVLAIEGLVVTHFVGSDHVEVLFEELEAGILLDGLGLGGEPHDERPGRGEPPPWLATSEVRSIHKSRVSDVFFIFWSAGRAGL